MPGTEELLWIYSSNVWESVLWPHLWKYIKPIDISCFTLMSFDSLHSSLADSLPSTISWICQVNVMNIYSFLYFPFDDATIHVLITWSWSSHHSPYSLYHSNSLLHICLSHSDLILLSYLLLSYASIFHFTVTASYLLIIFVLLIVPHSTFFLLGVLLHLLGIIPYCLSYEVLSIPYILIGW